MSDTLKFSRTSGTRTRLTLDDSPVLTLPNGDWAVPFPTVIDGVMSGYGGTTQWYVCSTDGSGSGSFLVALYPFDVSDSTKAGRFVLNFNSSVTDRCLSAPVEQGKAYIVVPQRQNGQVVTKICPVLTVMPTDGSAVLTSASSPLTVALDSASPWMIGDRVSSGRRCDQSIGPVAIVPRALTDFEIAKLAYGIPLTDIVAPTVFVKVSDPANIVDTGPNALPVTVSGPPTAGSSMGYGYVPTVNPPTVTGAPHLTGNVTVGVAKAYIAAPVAGTPTPTVKQQWMLDGADIAGATGATYTPVAGDVGKVLSVRQIASNVNGDTPSTSNGIVVCSVATSVTINELSAEWVFQQAGGFSVVPLAGTYTGEAPASIQYRLETPDGALVTKAWTTISGTTVSGGAWSASPFLPTAAKKHRIRGRALNAAGNVLFEGALNVNRFGVGANGIVVGSSTPAEWFGSGSAANLTPDHDRVSLFDGTTYTLFGEYGCASEMAAYLSQQFGYPVALASAARGGSGLADWLDNNPTSGTDWNRFLSRLSGMGGKIEFILGSVGSNDTISLSAVGSRANHLNNLRTFALRLRAASGDANLPIIWQGINRRTTETTNDLAAEYARMAENDFGSDANVYHYQTLQYILSSDGVHMLGSQARIAASELVKMGADGIKGNYRRGPKAVSYTYSGAGAMGATVNLQHRNGTDFTPTTGITGFTAGDANGALTAVGSRASASQIALAFDRAVVPPLWIKHLGGKGPDTTAAVMDNGAQSLPMNVETDLVPTVGSGGSKTVNLVGANCVQVNSCSVAAVIIGAGPKTVTLVGAPSSQANSSSSGAITINRAPKTVNLVGAACVQLNACNAGAVAVTKQDHVMSFAPSPSRTLTVSPTSKALTGGPWWNLTNPAKPRGAKDPQATLDVTLNWAPWLADIGSPPIAKFTATIFGVTQVGAFAEGALTTMVFSGGTAAEATITFEIETATTPPLKDERTVYIDLVNL